jgi:hypothetical protein
MSAERSSYRRAKDMIKDHERPTIPLSIKLKSGEEISGVTPYAVVPGHMDKDRGGEKTLRIFYLDGNDKAHKVDANNVQGLRVIEGSGDFAGKLMLEFTYFKGTSEKDFREADPRIIFMTDVYYGIHSFHEEIGETQSDFYLQGDDQQYPENRSRQFPLWRIDAYGDETDELIAEFKGGDNA